MGRRNKAIVGFSRKGLAYGQWVALKKVKEAQKKKPDRRKTLFCFFFCAQDFGWPQIIFPINLQKNP